MNKRLILTINLLILGMLQVSYGAQKNDDNLGIIPAPVSVVQKAGSFNLTTATKLNAFGTEERHVAGMLNQFLEENYGFVLSLNENDRNSENTINLSIKGGSAPAEGYQLSISKRGISILGSDAPGLFHGLQSMIQLLPVQKQNSYILPCAVINDYPRFRYRGMMLDCGRHFFPVSFIKEYLDLMARYKFNIFHWHLTEDEGWRLEIKKYPRLTEIGSKRKETVVGWHNSRKYDGVPYGGYYTQLDILEIVKYATERSITVIPEIELPGHSLAALASYPLLGCRNGPYEVSTTWGVFSDVYCAGKESTFQFLEDVLTEVIQLFPSHYIHIGGDEVRKDRWKTCPFCQKRIKDFNLKNEEGLQSYFIKRIDTFMNSHGREIIGWDEIMEGGLPSNAIVQSWRGEEGAIGAARQHHESVMSPSTWFYFDQYQSDDKREPLAYGNLPLQKVYNYDPIPAELNPDQHKYIRGVEACLWTEYIPNVKHAEYMTMPRMLAMAEVAWSPLETKNYNSFLQRIPKQLECLDKEHIHYRIPEPQGLQSDTTSQDEVIVKLQSYVPGTKIYYTLDIKDPTTHSSLYKEPIRINLKTKPTARLNIIQVTPSANTSLVYSANYVKAK